MAKAFLMYDTVLEKWKAGTFDSEGNINVDYTLIRGEVRDLWRISSDGLWFLTLRFSVTNAELSPFKNILITEVAKDLEGTPYASKSDFESTVKDLFIGTVGSVAAAAGFTAYEITVVLDQTDYALPLEADVNKDWIVSADGVSFSPSTDYTKSLVDGVPTISFNTAPTVGNVPVVWYQKSSQTLELLILRTIQNPGNAFAIDVSTADFVPTENTPFLIKNDGEDTVTLEVKYADGTDWISTKFKVGWNEDLVKAVKTNVTVMDLKGGVK